MRNLSDATINRIRELFDQGVTTGAICRRLGVGPSVVRAYSSGHKSAPTDIVNMPSWPLTGWELRAIEIREKKYEKHNPDFTLARIVFKS